VVQKNLPFVSIEHGWQAGILTKPCTCKVNTQTRRSWLRRLFSAYPGGLAGIGLVLLRSVIGFTAALQGVLYLATNTAATVHVVGGLAVLTGILLVTGFRTRLASFLVALDIAFISLFSFPLPTRDLFDRLLPTLFAETMSMAVVFLGPGAFSIDAYLYGRKEIIIPYPSRE
jgi:uncharacterized membrane protein YphA (DoxX/SURF4 family)